MHHRFFLYSLFFSILFVIYFFLFFTFFHYSFLDPFGYSASLKYIFAIVISILLFFFYTKLWIIIIMVFSVFFSKHSLNIFEVILVYFFVPAIILSFLLFIIEMYHPYFDKICPHVSPRKFVYHVSPFIKRRKNRKKYLEFMIIGIKSIMRGFDWNLNEGRSGG